MRKEPKNEQALCYAVIRLIGELCGESITNISSVDTVVRNKPAVEYSFEVGKTKFAIEHTRIESFPKQLDMSKKFAYLLEPLETELSGKLPGEFFLSVAVGDATASANKHMKIRKALSEWILATASTLECKEEVDFWENSNCSITEKLPNVPFEVTLERDTRYGSRLFIIQQTQGDCSPLQRDCIREALKRKCPKLSEEQAKGYKTILIIESDDPALCNQRVIINAIDIELSTRDDAPDIIIWARTSTIPWKAWFIKKCSVIHLPSRKERGQVSTFDIESK